MCVIDSDTGIHIRSSPKPCVCVCVLYSFFLFLVLEQKNTTLWPHEPLTHDGRGHRLKYHLAILSSSELYVLMFIICVHYIKAILNVWSLSQYFSLVSCDYNASARASMFIVLLVNELVCLL